MNQDELVFEDKTYVSSKRAAQMTDYAQDYIGQLCRGGAVDARRVNGLWYITLESLEKHKTTSAEIKAQAFSHIGGSDSPAHKSDTVLSFSGEEYVSSRHGAEVTGYNPDYITQLARAGKIRSRQIGSRWYVSKGDLVANKDKNDALLAAVQTSAVGLATPAPVPINIHNKKEEPSFEKHESESHMPLMPNLPEKPTALESTPVSEYEADTHAPYKVVMPVSIHRATPVVGSVSDKMPASYGFSGVRPVTVAPQSSRTLRPERKPKRVQLVFTTIVAIIVVVGGVYGARLALGGVNENANMASAIQPVIGNSWYAKVFHGIVGVAEKLVTSELNYTRVR